MGRVALILPFASASDASADVIGRYRQALEAAGHEVEAYTVLDADGGACPPAPRDRAWAWVQSHAAGLSAAVAECLRTADGEAFLVLDPRTAYEPDDLAGVLAPVLAGTADLVAAKRTSPAGSSWPSRVASGAFGLVSRILLGVTDPFSGLLALSPSSVPTFAGSALDPAGSRVAFDLLSRSRGRHAEAPVRVDVRTRAWPEALDDLRLVKRFADERFGNASRLIQFCAVGASGMVIDLTAYAIAQAALGRTALASETTPFVGGPLHLAAAGAVAIALALTWNFSLNRRWTFSYARHGSLVRQFLTYALSNALGIALSFTLRLYLPAHVGFFERHRLAAAVVGIVAATGISFSMARWLVFSRRSVARDQARASTRAYTPAASPSTVAETSKAR